MLTPIFEGCAMSLLATPASSASVVASAALTEVIAVSTSGRKRGRKGGRTGARGGGGGCGGGTGTSGGADTRAAIAATSAASATADSAVGLSAPVGTWWFGECRLRWGP
ncbi:unnamed protein product [Closterium sp. NIES-54]